MDKAKFSTLSDSNYFCGYYDKSPLNYNNTLLLVQRAAFNNRMPKKDDILEIGYINWQCSPEFIPITYTHAWNWQQGCMLQWIDQGKAKNIIYNDRINNKFVSVILNIDSLQKTILPMAYYTLSSNGDFALCIDFERHYWFRKGYCYQGIENHKKKINFDENDGIWYMDIVNKKVKQIISMQQLIEIKPLSNMKNAIHYVEHLMLSPNNKRFCFLHRWKLEDGSIYARFYTANVDGSDLFLLNDSGRMSHFCWCGNDKLVGWGALETPVNRLRKYKNIVKYFIRPILPIYKILVQSIFKRRANKLTQFVTGDSYILFHDLTLKKSKIFPSMLKEDGHPSFLRKNSNIMVTDTYPALEKQSKQTLYLGNVQENKVIVLAKISHPLDFINQAYRCDLHPKLSFDDNYVCIDVLENGIRSVKIYQLKSIKI